MRIEKVTVDGHTIRYGVRPGTQDRVPLLIFNGIGARLELLRPLADRFDRTEVIVFDAPGVGESSVPSLPYSMWQFARLARRMLDALGYPVVDVLGTSWGGAAAQQFAFQYAAGCRRLVLAATTAGGFAVPGSLSAMIKMINPWRLLDPEYMAEIGPELYGGAIAETPELFREHAKHMWIGDPLGYYYQLLAMIGWTSAFWLPMVRQPTLLLSGRRDPLVPLANAHILRLLIPNTTLRIFDDGHMFLLTSADESAAAIEDFLD
jgi:poly(3-hydroxyalkanoate) depolymerase